MKAKDCKCVRCEAPAVAFWPDVDIDIPSSPYCRKCLDAIKKQAFMDMYQTS